MRKRVFAFTTLLGLLITTQNSGAAIISVEFMGTYDIAGSSSFVTIFQGTTIRGEFVYETASAGGSSIGVYTGALRGLSLRVEGISPAGQDLVEADADTLEFSAPAAIIQVTDNASSGDDVFNLVSRTANGFSGTGFKTLSDISTFFISLEDEDMTVFSSGDLVGGLALSAFEEAFVDLSSSQGNAIFQISTLTSTLVPEPNTAWLLCTGLLGLLRLGRRRPC